jgi:hypothetical protein
MNAAIDFVDIVYEGTLSGFNFFYDCRRKSILKKKSQKHTLSGESFQGEGQIGLRYGKSRGKSRPIYWTWSSG